MSRSYIVMHSQRNSKLIRKKYSRVKVNRGFKNNHYKTWGFKNKNMS